MENQKGKRCSGDFYSQPYLLCPKGHKVWTREWNRGHHKDTRVCSVCEKDYDYADLEGVEEKKENIGRCLEV